MFPNLRIVDHPLVQHKLTLLRRKEESTGSFRQLLREISILLAYEATRDLPLTLQETETPLARMSSPVLAGKKLCLVSILRGGNGILDGMLEILPSARVGHIGLYRDPGTFVPVEYYSKLPEDIAERRAIVLNPLLATGQTASAAVQKLKDHGVAGISFICIVAAPEGMQTFSEAHPDVPVFAAALDQRLDAQGFIVPGLGDAGDRLYGTK
ncbi:MAG: uracil phosphoribosyltransferase [Alphaproteobacteria bacterium]|nr:uracil phosphoribosyltransferase [Alphaproteobacteria bacterium]